MATKKMYKNGSLETADVRTVHRLMQAVLEVLGFTPKTMPIVALARAANDCPESLAKGDAETRTDGTTCVVPKIRISPAITGDVREVVNALAHNAIHLALMAEGADFPKGTKHPRAFLEKAESLGLVCRLKTDDPHRNYLYSDVQVTDDQYRDIIALTGEINFNFEAIEKVASKKTDKKPVYTYISPNGLDIVKSENAHMNIWAKMGAEFMPWRIATDSDFQRRKALLAEQKRTTPTPSARQKTLA